ncbi:hypothetical protein CHLRE_05g243600v5 [Chlamydomonas reinhardtii]|uniref:Galactose oxidase-like Early set domain-containing protein n=1 Tax=Chlamydomonas reinhardtii TaxID=3055 RepID=A8I596_CHLRE|nr:uncharacterized protein CHLRE_05g243600v5 [Chlamydomonas reinhardtii]PNW83427.1 hypothetical protein CHLRE_05g243600v5 [Chlamydomonas reinhardtii]|eukprot:XP_001700735.1 glyoxal or galactose oxidase [Chlamydomonas reinhardtii]
MGYGTTHQIRYAWPAGFAGPQHGSSIGMNATAPPAADPYDVWTPGVITRVVLSAPCSNTHSFDMNQRLVGLEILSNTPDPSTGSSSGTTGSSSSSGSSSTVAGGVLTVRSPPDINIAPPGMYHMFLVHGDVYSSAV